MQAADIDSACLMIEFYNMDYIQAIISLQTKSGLIVRKVCHGNERIDKEMFKDWISVTGKVPTNRALYLALAYSSRGLIYPIEVWHKSKGFTISFNGMTQYKQDRRELTQTATDMRADFEDLRNSGIAYNWHKVDICIDSDTPIKLKVQKRRTVKRFNDGGGVKTGTYFNTKQGKKEQYLRAYSYNKQIKDNLNYELFRFEMCFGSNYFGKNRSGIKLENSINRTLKNWTGKDQNFNLSIIG
jgi:hypothetical protein